MSSWNRTGETRWTQEFGLAPLEDLSPDELERRGAGVIGVGRLLNAALGELGVSPDAVAGHSLGEWCGMIASGILDDAKVDSFIRTLKPGSLKLPGFVFAAAPIALRLPLAGSGTSL